MKKIIFLVLVILSITLGTIKIEAQTTVIMERDGNLNVIPCKINNIPMRLIFDTGASNVSISLTEARFMLKNGYLKEEDIVGTSLAQFADGNIAENTLIILRLVQIENIKIRNVKATIVHQNSAPLLFGQSAIERLGKIQIEGNILTILNEETNNFDFADLLVKTEEAKTEAKEKVRPMAPKKSACQRIPEMETSHEIVALKTGCWVWERQDVGGKLMATLTGGQYVKLSSRVYNWWKIECDGITGWINENHLDLPICRLWLESL